MILNFSKSNWIWFALLLSAYAALPVDAGGVILVNVSPFDVVVLILAVMSLLVHGWPRQLSKEIAVGAILIFVFVVHTAVLDQMDPDFERGWALRELVKMSAIIVLYLFGRVVLDGFQLSPPENGVVLTVIVLAVAILLTLHAIERAGVVFSYISRTTYVTGLWVLAFLYVQRSAWRHDMRAFVGSLILVFLLSSVCLIVLSKLGAAMGASFGMALVIVRTIASRTEGVDVRLVVRCVVLLAAAVVAFLGVLAFFDILQDLDSISRSFGVRADLWWVSIAGILDNGGAGIGLGQFKRFFDAVPALAVENHRFPHSVMLSFGAQFGPVGLCMFVGLIYVVYRAVTMFGTTEALVSLTFLVPLILFHDIHGVRTLILLVALGLSMRYQSNSGIATAG